MVKEGDIVEIDISVFEDVSVEVIHYLGDITVVEVIEDEERVIEEGVRNGERTLKKNGHCIENMEEVCALAKYEDGNVVPDRKFTFITDNWMEEGHTF